MYRPTTLRLADRHCPRAVDHYEQHRPYFREHFSAGIAAHAVLDVLGQQTVKAGQSLNEVQIEGYAEAAARVLLVRGREFDGEREPPMAADAVFEGRDLAVRWAKANPLSPTARYELGAGFTAEWHSAGYRSEDSRFRLIFDVLDEIEIADEESAGRGVLVRDYKTAWPTGADELDTLQMRAQAVCASILYPRADFVRQEVVNLRTGEAFTRTLWLQDGTQIVRWRQDLTTAMDALDEMAGPADVVEAEGDERGANWTPPPDKAPSFIAYNGRETCNTCRRHISRHYGGTEYRCYPRTDRPARPGPGCLGCPWAPTCDDAARFTKACGMDLEAEDVARRFAAADARRQAFFALAKAATEEQPVKIDGAVVGYVVQPGREPLPDAAARVYTEWAARRGDLPGFLAALKPGVTALQGAARVLAPRDRDAQDELVARWTAPRTRAEFGVHKKEER